MKWGIVLLVLPMLTGCVTVAEFRKLENEVIDMRRGRPTKGGSGGRERLAELAARLEVLEQQTERLGGRVEVAEHRAKQALAEARLARQEASGESQPGSRGSAQTPLPVDDSATSGSRAVSQEVAAYRSGYAAYRKGEWSDCIDRFRNFLQTYPSSAYADDAAFWLADSYFKQGDYKTAILRFDDVVTTYPDGNQAAEALFRQGESLQRLGPGFGKAAGKAFERVVKEYPQSARADDAKHQLDLLRTR
jgi:tol-pal system protein YbgF